MTKSDIPMYFLAGVVFLQLCVTMIDGGVISQDNGIEKVFKKQRYRRDADEDEHSTDIISTTSPYTETTTFEPPTPFPPTGGAVYVRWGRKTCPDTSELIYEGAVGGSFFASTGGGSNYLCLPLDPIYGNVTPSADKQSKLYGAEFENPTGFKLDNAQSITLQDENVPCAVCQSLSGDHYLMIPARNECYPGWTQEYDGFLVSGANVHAGRTEFLCMDGSPETMTSGYPDQNGVLFYNVAGTCGSLPCPPYVENYELTCVVCTK